MDKHSNSEKSFQTSFEQNPMKDTNNFHDGLK